MPKVMIIDDAPAMRNSLSRVLRKEGYDAVAVGDGLQALGTANAQPPDLIILDLAMPHMNGIEVLKRLRSSLLWKSVPVLVFSGMALPATVQKARELGVSDVLPKGETSVADLVEKVKTLINPDPFKVAAASFAGSPASL